MCVQGHYLPGTERGPGQPSKGEHLCGAMHVPIHNEAGIKSGSLQATHGDGAASWHR